jgi:hypothetical protein
MAARPEGQESVRDCETGDSTELVEVKRWAALLRSGRFDRVRGLGGPVSGEGLIRMPGATGERGIPDAGSKNMW